MGKPRVRPCPWPSPSPCLRSRFRSPPPRPQRHRPRSRPSSNATPITGPAARLVGNMEESLRVPTATTFRELPVGVLEARRRELNNALRNAGRPEKVSFTHLIGFALVRAAHAHPVMTTVFDHSGGTPARINTGKVEPRSRSGRRAEGREPRTRRPGNPGCGVRKLCPVPQHLRVAGRKGAGEQADARCLRGRQHDAHAIRADWEP